MTRDMTIREVTREDLPALQRLGRQGWGEFSQQMLPENWAKLQTTVTSAQTYESLFNQAWGIVALTPTHHIAGMCFLVPSGNPTVIYEQEWCYIRLLTVDPYYAGRGIGRSLLEECIAHARQNGEETIALHSSEMMNRALDLYAKLGFLQTRELSQILGKRYWLYTMDLAVQG